jgi:hypothetical protein
MANPEHLEILEQGVEAWNKWRGQHTDIRPDLVGADLVGADLRRANLSRADFYRASLRETKLYGANLSRAFFFQADLSGADLSRANLSRADLSRANLSGANLAVADLTGADLIWADLIGTILIEANLTEANLTWAVLRGVDLTEANLSQVVLYETVLGNTDLTTVRGLETCYHRGPSILDHSTIAKSGPLPLAFLRGCGLPDALIDYLPSLLNEPIQYYSCFISYASKDHALAERLHADLQNKGVRCWFAPEDMKIGDEFRSRIDASIHVHDRLLLILSEHSIKSPWVQTEVETAFEKEAKEHRLVLFPLRLDDAVMDVTIGWAATIRRQRHIGDFTQWKDHDVYQKAFDRLLRDLKNTKQQPEG